MQLPLFQVLVLLKVAVVGVVDQEGGFDSVGWDGVLVEFVAFKVQDQELLGVVDDGVEADVDFLVG